MAALAIPKPAFLAVSSDLLRLVNSSMMNGRKFVNVLSLEGLFVVFSRGLDTHKYEGNAQRLLVWQSCFDELAFDNVVASKFDCWIFDAIPRLGEFVIQF